MKILLLVQSCELARYPELIQVQKETWDSVSHPDINTIFYYPHPTKTGLIGKDLYFEGEPHWMNNYQNMMKAFTRILKMEWDILFKTDNTAYINKDQLVKVLKDKPLYNFYGGQLYDGPNPNPVKEFIWGEGMGLSRNLVQKLVDIYAMDPDAKRGAEDVHIGYIFKDKFPWDTTMPVFEYYKATGPVPKTHVYRCKKDDKDWVPFDDEIKAMRDIHKQLTHENTSTSNVV